MQNRCSTREEAQEAFAPPYFHLESLSFQRQMSSTEAKQKLIFSGPIIIIAMPFELFRHILSVSERKGTIFTGKFKQKECIVLCIIFLSVFLRRQS